MGDVDAINEFKEAPDGVENPVALLGSHAAPGFSTQNVNPRPYLSKDTATRAIDRSRRRGRRWSRYRARARGRFREPRTRSAERTRSTRRARHTSATRAS